ncbi:hypothetical protein [Pseudomonas typographi]|uniref:hypothetical protein n=1 Tax=Pseudomonas typographi TaxID=2715964 RepID=UPI001687CEEC|nr:hypothetical protein [Pseudomonas typographi]MBD1554765.1 hypothetical protein [Pseudomonas typographi]
MASEYSSTTSQLISFAQTALNQAATAKGSITFLTKPTLTKPTLDFTVADKSFGDVPVFSDLFGGTSGSQAISDLDDNVDAWLAKRFPAINGSFQTLPEDWIANIVSGVKPFGVDSTIFDLVWHQARDRAYRTAKSERATLAANASARGFTLPSGALLDQLDQAEQRATAATLDVVREQAIKDADIKVQLLQHATQLASQLKLGILNISADYFRSYYQAYNRDLDAARIRADAYRSYYSALAQYYDIEVAWKNLQLQAAEAKAGIAQGNDRNLLGLFEPGSANAALGQVARAFGDVAAQAANAAGTLVAQIENVS